MGDVRSGLADFFDEQSTVLGEIHPGAGSKRWVKATDIFW